MSSLYDALADVTFLGTNERLKRVEERWDDLSPREKSYVLVDLGMRLGRLTAVMQNRVAMDLLTQRFRRLESALLRSL